MAATRHRRDVPRRTVLIGSVLAVVLGGGLLALGLVPDSALRPVLMGVLLVAVGAGVLAVDEARLAQGRTDAALSRERADRVRTESVWSGERDALVARVNELDRELAEIRRAALRPRALVVVAEPRPPARVARILEIPDAVPADVPQQQPVVVDVKEARGPIETDPTIDIPVVDATVLGEFSLDGLSMFPRPAGMPEAFPAPATTSDASDVDERAVIDLRARQSESRRTRPA
jgi:hypothetical protein